MSKISQYASALVSKLTDIFVVAQDNNGTLETKGVTTSQIGTAINETQTFSNLNTSDETVVGAINEVKSKADAVSSLVVVQDFSESATIAAGVAVDVDFSCAKTGYTLIGIAGFNCYYADLVPTRASIRTTNQIRMNVRNVGSTSRSASITVTALYVKTIS